MNNPSIYFRKSGSFPRLTGAVLCLGALTTTACGGSDTEDFEPQKVTGLEHIEGGHSLGKRVVARDPSALPALPKTSVIGETSQPIINGTVTPAGSTTAYGVLMIWAFVTKVNEWRQICTASIITNNVVLTAAHCFDDPKNEIPDGNYAFQYGNQITVSNAALADPNGLDVAVLQMATPFTIANSTTGFVRRVASGGAGRTVMAMGYGSFIPGQSPEPSTICNSGTKGCPSDPRPQRYSFHTSNWQNGWNGGELWVGVNGLNQLPGAGDSGSAMFDFYAANIPIIGVFTSNFNASPPTFPTAHSHYEPVQDYSWWLCNIAICQ